MNTAEILSSSSRNIPTGTMAGVCMLSSRDALMILSCSALDVRREQALLPSGNKVTQWRSLLSGKLGMYETPGDTRQLYWLRILRNLCACGAETVEYFVKCGVHDSACQILTGPGKPLKPCIYFADSLNVSCDQMAPSYFASSPSSIFQRVLDGSALCCITHASTTTYCILLRLTLKLRQDSLTQTIS